MREIYKKSKVEAWAPLEKRYRLCLNKGAEWFMSTTPLIEQALAPEARKWLGCGDEGVTVMEEVQGVPVHLAGSGILAALEPSLAKIIKRNGWEEVTVHPGCAAAAQCGGDAAGEEFGKTVAQRAGVPYRLIQSSWMRRPAAFHHAVAVYYDGTGCFNWGGVPKRELLPGFVVSRRYVSAAYAKEEVGLYCKVALGAHGLGVFGETTPLLLIAIGDPRAPFFSAKQLSAELSAVKRKTNFGRFLKVDGYTAAFLAK